MARRVTVAGGGFGIDTREFKNMVRALRQAQPEITRHLRSDLRAAGELVAEDARRRAGEHSTTIAATIKVRTVNAAVAVEAGGGDSPLAGLFELGNAGKGSSQTPSKGGTFRHPVYGRDVWVEQQMHPFLQPAALHNAPAVEKLILGALDAATQTIVLGR